MAILTANRLKHVTILYLGEWLCSLTVSSLTLTIQHMFRHGINTDLISRKAINMPSGFSMQSCNIVDLTKKLKPPPTPPPTKPPVEVDVATTPSPANAPTEWAIQWIDIEKEEEGEVSLESGTPAIDVTAPNESDLGDTTTPNPTITKTPTEVPTEKPTWIPTIMPSKAPTENPTVKPTSWLLGLVDNIANGGESDEEVVPITATTDTPVPTYSPTLSYYTPSPSSSVDGDILETFFCGVDPIDASNACQHRCRSGSSDECPGKLQLLCFFSATDNLLDVYSVD